MHCYFCDLNKDAIHSGENIAGPTVLLPISEANFEGKPSFVFTNLRIAIAVLMISCARNLSVLVFFSYYTRNSLRCVLFDHALDKGISPLLNALSTDTYIKELRLVDGKYAHIFHYPPLTHMLFALDFSKKISIDRAK